MDNYELEMQEIINRYGDWTAYDIKLTANLYTMKQRFPYFQLRKIVQLISDIYNNDWKNLRILDLACLEGQYAIEFALHGASVVGIEGREQNFMRANFAKKVLNIANLDFYNDDVRNLSKEKYGEFDIVLCSGILYHLDFPDNMELINNIYNVCNNLAIIDTHIGIEIKDTKSYKGFNYEGDIIREHESSESMEQRLNSHQKAWASLDNEISFWLSKTSLYEYLMRVGFTSITEMYSHNNIAKFQGDRIGLLAFKGRPVTLDTSPATNGLSEPLDRLSEKEALIQRLSNENHLSYSTISQIVNVIIQFQNTRNNMK